jgi:hypothetical protein
MNSYDQANSNYNQLPQRMTPPVIIGNFKVMHRPGHAFERTRARLTRQDLRVQATPHFLFAHIPENTKGYLGPSVSTR